MCNISQLSKYVWMLGAVLLLCIVSTFYFLPGSSAEAQSDATRQIYLPLVVDHSTNSVGQYVDSNPIIDAEWPTYTSEKGGYSLRYPNNWTIEEFQKGSIIITDQNSKPIDKITVGYLDFEKLENDDLVVWAKRYFALGLGPDLPRIFSKITLDVIDPDDTSQQISIQYTPPVPGAGYLITRGRLVLQIATDSATASVIEQLQIVANSASFADSSPTDQSQLSAPDKVPTYISIEAWQQRQNDLNIAADAVTYRLQTGEVATHLLAIMSDNAKKEYERMLADAADYIAEMDRQRAAQASPTPSPTSNPTPNPTPNPGANSDEFLEQERVYNEGLKKSALPENKQEGHKQKTLDSSIEIFLEFPDVDPDVGPKDIANRRGLPARVTTPIRIYPFNTIKCFSDKHYGKDTYAIDIMVGVGTPVYGTTQNEYVDHIVTDPTLSGYGKYVWTVSQQNVRGIWKNYHHIYAHLSRIDVTPGSFIQPNTQVGLSGNTGDTGGDPHLHFQIHTLYAVDGNSGGNVPVDLSPIKGFTPNLNYPLTGICGVIGDPANEPVIIEANEFQSWNQPVITGHYWNCSTYFPNHTGTCYRAVVPVSPEFGVAPLTNDNKHLTPRISYNVWFPAAARYRVWVCGMGGNVNDDSLHMGQNSLLFGTADDMSGYDSTSWVWRSLAMDGTSPYLDLVQNYNNIDLYARENGMRVDRILLTKDFNYNPTTAGIRCGAQGLY